LTQLDVDIQRKRLRKGQPLVGHEKALLKRLWRKHAAELRLVIDRAKGFVEATNTWGHRVPALHPIPKDRRIHRVTADVLRKELDKARSELVSLVNALAREEIPPSERDMRILMNICLPLRRLDRLIAQYSSEAHPPRRLSPPFAPEAVSIATAVQHELRCTPTAARRFAAAWATWISGGKWDGWKYVDFTHEEVREWGRRQQNDQR
jgi:hypothetical protein